MSTSEAELNELIRWSIDKCDEALAEKFNKLNEHYDTEAAHYLADNLLIEWLRLNELPKAAAAFEAMDKWYA